jgi:nicotinamide-nucleotide amidase
VSARAGIVVTGTEVLTGRVADRNGPWLADRLLELGVELAHITICGDRAADIEAQLHFMAGEGVDLIVTSGGPPWPGSADANWLWTPSWKTRSRRS